MRASIQHDRKPRLRASRKLTGYAIAAAASLVAEDALAEIRYTDLGPNGVVIQDLTGFNIDLDGDSNADFLLFKEGIGGLHCTTTFYDECTFSHGYKLTATGFRANQILTTAGGINAVALPSGFQIDVADQGDSYGTLAYALYLDFGFAQSSQRAGGEFLRNRAYLGLTFDLPDGRHAGWADVFTTAPTFHDGQLEVRLYGFAYEATPSKAIAAGAVPEPPSLALLAAGATGLAALKKKRKTPT